MTRGNPERTGGAASDSVAAPDAAASNALAGAGVAILARRVCPLSIAIARRFARTGSPVTLMLIETAERRRFSAQERAFQRAHQAFNERRGEAGRGGRLRMLWTRLPQRWRAMLRRHAARVPLLNRLATDREARRLGIAVDYVRRHSSAEAADCLMRCGIRYVLVGSSNWLLKDPLLSLDSARILNAHCAKLPEHRGLDALPWSVMEGDPTGVSVHLVDTGVDTGPLVLFREVPPRPGETLLSLRRRVDEAIPEAYRTAVAGIEGGSLQSVAQAPEAGTHHRPMTLEELEEAERVLATRSPGQRGPEGAAR
ncbi:MAG: hypothetical protein KAY32_08340 [Candidatus Eisenbacteria sp.]|nr:hypothetical protein [Candidatus Eisenbacteria bacterium]